MILILIVVFFIYAPRKLKIAAGIMLFLLFSMERFTQNSSPHAQTSTGNGRRR